MSIKYKNTKVIEVNDWDGLVKKTYNKPYSFQQQDGCKDRGNEYIQVPTEHPKDFENTSIPFELNSEEMGVSFDTWLNISSEDIAAHFDSEWENELFWERNFYPHIDVIANDLYKKGLIEAGEYTINIDW